MKILVIGGNGTLGKQICRELAQEDEIITAGRNSGDYRVDITSPGSIRQLFEQINGPDACICVAASGALDDFQTLTEDELLSNMKGKFFGQANLVLIGQHYLNKGGSFTLTSGVFADHPAKSVTGGGVVSGALHSFVLSAALELKDRFRVNCISPGMAEDSVKDFGHLFPDLKAVSMERLTEAYRQCVYGKDTGEIFRIY